MNSLSEPFRETHNKENCLKLATWYCAESHEFLMLFEKLSKEDLQKAIEYLAGTFEKDKAKFNSWYDYKCKTESK